MKILFVLFLVFFQFFSANAYTNDELKLSIPKLNNLQFLENGGGWNVYKGGTASMGAVYSTLIQQHNCEFFQTYKIKTETRTEEEDYFWFFCPSFKNHSKMIECRSYNLQVNFESLSKENQKLNWRKLGDNIVYIPQVDCRTR